MSQEDGIVNETDWEGVVIDTAFVLQDKEFSTMYTFRKKQPERDKILVFMANNDKKVTRKDIRNANIAKNVSRCLNELKNLGAIKEDDDEILHLHSQLFRTAILLDLAYRSFINFKNNRLSDQKKSKDK